MIIAALWLTNHEVAARVEYLWGAGRYLPLAVFAGIWASALAALFHLAWQPPSKLRALWVGAVVFSTFTGDLFFRVTDERITVRAVDTMWHPFQGQIFEGAALSLVNMYAYYIGVAVLATTVLAVGLLLRVTAVFRPSEWRFAVVPFVPLALLVGLVFYSGGGHGVESRGMPQQFQSASVLSVFLLTTSAIPTKDEVVIPLATPAAARHIVLIVDESVRGDFIDLQGQQDVTPYLASISSRIIDFGHATSAHNCSDGSNAILRMGADPRTMSQNPIGNPSIWKYARRAGFESNYFDGQGVVPTRRDFVNDEEIGLIDHVIGFPSSLLPHEVDHDMARRLAEVLERDAPQFVLANKRGAHFPYRRRYPETATVFEPVLEAGWKITDKAALENTYRNAIRWSVDGFFERLLPLVDLSEVLLIYTSDHGQNLLDDGKPVTHCRNSPNGYEALVPLLVFTRSPELSERFREAARLNRDRASHFQVFPTLLTLMGYPREAVEGKYFGDLFVYQESALGFTSGSITGRFGRRPTWHSRP